MRRYSRNVNITGILVSLLFIALGIAMLIPVVNSVVSNLEWDKQHSEALNWPVTLGTITSHKVESAGFGYRGVFTYSYEVDGRQFVGKGYSDY